MIGIDLNKPNNQGVAVYIRDFGMLYTQMNLAMKTYISSERSCKNESVLHIALFIYFRYNLMLRMLNLPSQPSPTLEVQVESIKILLLSLRQLLLVRKIVLKYQRKLI